MCTSDRCYTPRSAMTHYRHLVDYDLQFFEEVAELIDRRLDGLHKDIEATDGVMDPGFLIDHCEYMIGVGFITAQVYLNEVIATADRKLCLGLGPLHANGQSVAAIVSAGADYAKHSPSPPLHAPTRRILDACGVFTPDGQGAQPMNPLMLLLTLVTPDAMRFATLVPLLVKWRDGVIAAGLA